MTEMIGHIAETAGHDEPKTGPVTMGRNPRSRCRNHRSRWSEIPNSLTQIPEVPVAELKVVKRYGGAIADAAQGIRDGRWPTLPSDPSEPIAFIHCNDRAALPAMVLSLYREDAANTQILCARRGGTDGTKWLNSMFQSALTAGAAPVLVWDVRHDAYAHAGFNVGDAVLCTRNRWDRGLQNGSLGIVVEVDSQPQPAKDEDGYESAQVLAWVDWDDGERRPIVEEMLDDLELGFAVTVHKAQGSQWPRIVVPLTGNRLLDRTLVYTAVTRAQRQVLLVGDEAAARAAVEGAPRAHSRKVALDLTLLAMLSEVRGP